MAVARTDRDAAMNDDESEVYVDVFNARAYVQGQPVQPLDPDLWNTDVDLSALAELTPQERFRRTGWRQLT